MTPASLHVQVDSGLRLARASLPPGLETALRAAVSVPNPEHAKRQRLGLSLWGVPELLQFTTTDGADLCLPRGASHVLKRVARAAGIEVAFDDRRLMPAEQLPELPDARLWPYQARAVEAMVRLTQGIVVAPCGSGKTRLAIGAIAALRTPALVLVHQRELAGQWRAQLLDVLGIEAGLVGCGEELVHPVTVAMVQTLARWDDVRLDALLERFGALILDECHHVAAGTFARIVDRSPSRYRFGLSATPTREDGLTAVLELYLGRPVATITHAELKAAGVLVTPRVRTVETSFAYRLTGPDDYGPMLAALVADRERNELVATYVAHEADAGHLCLALSARVAHCRALAELIRAHGVEAHALTGDVPKRRRGELLEAARKGDVQVLVATQLADEGLDWPALERVFLVCPGKARGRTVQRLGRVMRAAPGKVQPELIDFVDERVPLLRRQAARRREAFGEVLSMARAA